MPPQLEISGDVPTSVHVRVRGRSALLRRMVPADLNLRMDMNNAKQGVASLLITTEKVGVPFGATVVEVSPSEIRVTLVPRHTPAPPGG
jgi:YbbR domain-containing protein